MLTVPDCATMCWYDNYKYACHDWKWGNHKERCDKQHRMGETCGLRLIHTTIVLPEKCATCIKIERKQRRLSRCMSNLKRWRKQRTQRKASIEVAGQEAAVLIRVIGSLDYERSRAFRDVTSMRGMRGKVHVSKVRADCRERPKSLQATASQT